MTRLLITEHGQDGTRNSLSDFGGEMTLSVETPAGDRTPPTPVPRGDVPTLLEQCFGLREPEPED